MSDRHPETGRYVPAAPAAGQRQTRNQDPELLATTSNAKQVWAEQQQQAMAVIEAAMHNPTNNATEEVGK